MLAGVFSSFSSHFNEFLLSRLGGLWVPFELSDFGPMGMEIVSELAYFLCGVHFQSNFIGDYEF